MSVTRQYWQGFLFMKFVIYSRKSKDAQDGHKQHTHLTAEWHIQNYLKSLDAQGINYEVVDSYEENFSGGGYYTKRPIFSKVVEMCKSDKSLTLLVSKADRLCRNVRTGSELMETINFTLANAPDADDLQKQLEFMIAEREWKNTSDRFKDMYQAKKKRCEEQGEDFIWGAASPKHRETFNRNKAAGLHKTPVRKVQQPELLARLKQMVSDSNSSLTQQEMVVKLNAEGWKSARGKELSQGMVSKLLKEL